MRWHQQKKPLVAHLRIRRSIRWLILLPASLALFTGLISAAEAQNKPGLHPPIQVHREYKIIKGHRVLIETHADPLSEFLSDTPVGLPLKKPAGHPPNGTAAGSEPPDGGDKTVVNSTPSSNCPVVGRSTDDNANSFQDPTTPSIKVIYAYASDQPNRFATYGPVIEAGASAMAGFVGQESGNTKSIQFDLGTANGPACLDIQTIALPHTQAYYQASDEKQTYAAFGNLSRDVHAALGQQPDAARNYLIYADNISSNTYGGLGDAPGDDSVAGASEGVGDYNAVLFGRNGTDFFGSSTSYAPGTTSQTLMNVSLHELSHNLGAVHYSAPHTTSKGHCTDSWDIMCYPDGGKPMISPPPCQGAYSASHQAYDCNKDDYFNPAPAPGSYLATHWNLYNSVFMCPIKDCAPPDTTPPIVTLDSGPYAGSTLHGNQPSFSFSSPENRTAFECNWDNVGWQACSSPNRAPSPLANGSHSFALRGSDPSHNIQTIPARSFTVDNTKPGPQILSLNLVGGHGGFTNDYDPRFSYSTSPSGLVLSCWLDDDDPSEPCPANASTFYAIDDGAHTLHLQVTDPTNGEFATASLSFTVDTESPSAWFTSKVPKKIHKHSQKFYFASSEAPSSFVCQLDSKAKVGCTSGYAVKHLKKGHHVFRVWAQDQAANRSDNPATTKFEVK